MTADASASAWLSLEKGWRMPPMADDKPERCPHCGVTDYSEHCRYRYEDLGCDHPALLREVEADLSAAFGDTPKHQ
jgi:hypothetical protein